MRLRPLLLCAACAALAAGCAHVEMMPEGEPDRAIMGTVNIRSPDFFPAGSVVVIRIVDNAPLGGTGLVLGEQTLTPPAGSDSAEFKVGYHAEDDVLRRGVELQVRVSVGGKLALLNSSTSSRLTLGHESEKQEIWVTPAGG